MDLSQSLRHPVHRTRFIYRFRRKLSLPLIIAVLAILFWQAFTWPNPAELRYLRPNTTAIWKTEKTIHNSWVNANQISPAIKHAVIASEDMNFLSHSGFDLFEIREAVTDMVEEGDFRGASTISQQLAKNLWLGKSKTIFRKFKEAILTIELEHTVPKARILEIYLNVVEFGPGIFGVEAASRSYFGKSASYLSNYEAAQLAASLPNPKRWNPRSITPWYIRRTNRILSLMEQTAWLRSSLRSAERQAHAVRKSS